MTRGTASSSSAARWDRLAADAAACTRCELHRCGSVTVFGDGPVPAPLMLVGEQPGDAEDRLGEPFVGPSGKLLRHCMDEAGLDVDAAYFTNAVKHFRWEARGKRRIHRAPGTEHVRACHTWLEQELRLVDPSVVVLLGATAARSFDPSLRVTRDRGRLRDVAGLEGRQVLVTVHPSSILRSRSREAARAQFVEDLRVVGAVLPS